MRTPTEQSLEAMVKLMRKKLELLEQNSKLLKEQNELLKALINERKGGYYYSVTKSTVAEEEDDEDDEDHDICYTCGYNRSDTDPIEDQMNCVKYCTYCENGSRWIPKEDENGGE